MNTLHDRLVLSADKFIKDYRDDLLVHDKTDIEENPNVPFLHFTGESGTRLIHLLPFESYPKKGEKVPYLFGNADREHILKDTKELVFSMRKSTRQDLILYYDGQTATRNLFDISQDMAEQIITTYYKKMKFLFKEVRQV